MWTSSWLLILSLALNHVCAQDLSSIPQCGQNCFNVAFNEFSRSCPSRDAACLCSQPGFDPEISACTAQQCLTATDSNTTLAFLQTYCGPTFQSTSGTTVILPTTITGASGAATSTTLTPSLPVANATTSTSATGNTPTVITVTSSGQSATTMTGGMGSTMSSATGTASASVATSINAGNRAGLDASVVLFTMVSAILSAVFYI